MSIDFELLRTDIVSDASEDYWGLYEIIWSLNTKYPPIAVDAKISAARQIVQDLLNDNSIALHETTWPSNHFRIIERDEALTRILDDAAWFAPTDRPYLSCLATNRDALDSER